ncbi:MAG: alkaline phosphatase D family protein [Litoreibacter sp.]|nr:alkaline phosphatase D family protein [Litoreibacter sp.]
MIFVSCCSPRRKEQPAWRWITARDPDLLLLLGDNIYAKNDGWDLADMAQKYRERLSDPEFRHAIDRIPTLATWDDHDIGPNNMAGDSAEARVIGETGLERREEARLQFLSHLSPRGVRADQLTRVKGEIYCSYLLNGVLVILLDGRFHRQNIREVGANGQFLGEAQEAWLWGQLERAQSESVVATVVCCGSTIDSSNQLGEDISHYRRFYTEFVPRFRACPNPIFLSGDIHRNAYVRHRGFVEGISSGVAQIRKRIVSETFPDGLEETNNYGMLEIFPDRARFTFGPTDYGVKEEVFPIKGVQI